MFDTPQPYAAHLRVGVHSWDVASTDDPTFGPLAGVRFSWAARQDDGWPTQHDPTVLVFGVVVEAGVDFADVDQGTVVHFTFTPDGYASPLVEFGGTVRDLTAAPHDRGMVYTITAVDHLKALQEDYTVQAYIEGDSPSSLLWTEVLKDAGGAGGGEGIRPALVDPFVGDVIPYSLGGGFLGTDPVAFGDPTPEPAWNVLTGLLAQGISRLGVAGGPGYRGILHYRLDASGDLDAAQPYEGTWVPMGAGNAPLSLVDGLDGWTDGGGNVDACLLRLDATVWARQRVEPNRAEFTGFLSGLFYERPHTGPDVTRYLDDDGPAYLSDVTDPSWIVAGVEASDQWGTEFALLGAYDPAVVAGWLTPPTAMRVAVGVHSIDPRHTPNGSGRMFGMLAGAALVIPPGGRWQVLFRLRRTLPDSTGPYGTQTPPDAITFADVAAAHPALTLADLDPTLTIGDTELIGD